MQQELTTLLLQAKAGSEEAFCDLVRRLEGRVYRGALALTANNHEARDLTQETFVRAYLGLGRFKEKSSPFTWLYGILLNVFREWLRQNKKFRAVGSHGPWATDDARRTNEPGLPACNPPPGETRETVTLIYRAISHLPHKQRMAVVMRCLEQMSYGEIAQAMRCSVGTVKSQIHDARTTLDKELSAQGIVYDRKHRPDEPKA